MGHLPSPLLCPCFVWEARLVRLPSRSPVLALAGAVPVVGLECPFPFLQPSESCSF